MLTLKVAKVGNILDSRLEKLANMPTNLIHA
jgi:hypothetical protein